MESAIFLIELSVRFRGLRQYGFIFGNRCQLYLHWFNRLPFPFGSAQN